MPEGLREWILCDRGDHWWVDYETDDGDVFTWCLWCGADDEGGDK